MNYREQRADELRKLCYTKNQLACAMQGGILRAIRRMPAGRKCSFALAHVRATITRDEESALLILADETRTFPEFDPRIQINLQSGEAVLANEAAYRGFSFPIRLMHSFTEALFNASSLRIEEWMRTCQQ